MAQDGILWFKGNTPGSRVQKLSVFAGQIDGLAEEAVADSARAGSEAMFKLMDKYQQRDGQITGRPARVSGEMQDSIGYKMQSQNARGRTTGEFGYINSPPPWVKYKEDGLGHMIKMNAMAHGALAAEDAMQDALDEVGAQLERRWDEVFR